MRDMDTVKIFEIVKFRKNLLLRQIQRDRGVEWLELARKLSI